MITWSAPKPRRPINSLLVDVVAVETSADARRVVAEDPRLRAVTPAGQVFGAGWAASGHGGSTPVELAEKVAAEKRGVEKKRNNFPTSRRPRWCAGNGQ